MSDLPDEVRFAHEFLPLYQDTDWEWAHEPIDSNYDPARSLSATLATVRGATGSSPTQILFFHFGQYAGTGHTESRPFISLRHDACTVDTVAVRFKVPGASHAGPPKAIHDVQYTWLGKMIIPVGQPPDQSAYQ